MIEIIEECPACSGTGLYVGMCELDGIAVVCQRCKGTGACGYNYKPFEGRKTRKDIKRVLQANPGIVATADCNFDFGGMTYEDWTAEKPFPPKSEMREYTCPAWWYQSVDHEKKPKWNKCSGLGDMISDCVNYPYLKVRASCN